VGQIVVFVGAGVFTFSALVTWLTYWDWVPRTCTLAGCPSAYSIAVIYSYMIHSYDTILLDILGLTIMFVGFGLARKARTSVRVPILLGIAAAITLLMLLYAPLNTAPVTYISPVTSATTVSTATTGVNSISLQGVRLCASVCIYPSPYLSATILVNGSVPLSTLRLLINGTDEGITTTTNTMTNYALLYKGQPTMPILDGKTYVITVVATFQDNSTYTASATVVASSGIGITTTNT
jgi:hypothetical protein